MLGWVFLGAGEPDALYLTWVDDPTTTMTVVWHGGEASRVMYHPVGDARWMSVTAKSHTVSDTSVKVYVSQIEELKSDSTYVFKIEGSRREFKFRTLPKKLTREVRLVVGGDLLYYWGTEVLDRMNRAVSYDDPDFVVIGGDLAYTTGSKRSLKGRVWEVERWQEFFRVMQKTMVAKEGRMIPMIPVVGNHDVHRKSTKRVNQEVFYEVFPFPQEGKAYRNLKIGNYLSLVLLDTGHTSPIEGAQTEWLQSILANDKTAYLFSIYHVGAYPSVYKYKGSTPELLRKTWVPLFEEAQICGAFEHHSHALKRTYPIKKGKKDPNGVVYFGDGSWGVPPRNVRSPQELWYLAMSASVNACWFIHLTKKGAAIEARTMSGEMKDRVVLPPRQGGNSL
ncbi:MAG: fibronectin type III domain-containing protein [Rhabdochlamydiaceae bacterium]